MQHAEPGPWLEQSRRRQRILLAFKQPLTAKHLSQQTAMKIDDVSFVLQQLVSEGLIECLTPRLHQNRIYWLSESGKLCQAGLRQKLGLQPLKHEFPILENWPLFSFVLYSHRSAVVKTLWKYKKTMQPAGIKRKACFDNPGMRMSANNARDAIRALREGGIVRRVKVRWKHFPHYELTEQGLKLGELLARAGRQEREWQKE